MDTDPPARGFRWSDVTAADREWLRRRTEDVVTYAYRTACDLVRLGQVLAEVRARVPRGTYVAWLADQTPFSTAHAYRLLAVADAFGAYLSQIEKIEPCALYLLAQVSTPPAARELAVQAAGDGRRVTRALALEMLAAARPEPEPTAAEVRAHERRAAGLKLEAKAQPAAGEGSPAWLWTVFEELVANSRLVHVAKVDDPDDDVLYTVTCHRELDTPVVAVRRSLGDAVAAAAGREPVKVCPGCGADKAVGEFGFDATNADGRNRYCKVCERNRRSENRKKARERKRRPGAGPAA